MTDKRKKNKIEIEIYADKEDKLKNYILFGDYILVYTK